MCSGQKARQDKRKSHAMQLDVFPLEDIKRLMMRQILPTNLSLGFLKTHGWAEFYWNLEQDSLPDEKA